MKLTIRSIIRWEQLNQKPFSSVNYGNENEIVSLFYACSISEGSDITLEAFRGDLTPESIKEMAGEFEKQTLFISQFQTDSKKNTDDSKDSDPVYIKDVVAMLIMDGLDVHFAMDEMQLYELSILLQAYEQKFRQQQESARLWTFIQVSPYLSKKVKTPQDLCPFEWEKETKKERSEEQQANDLLMFEAFMNSGKKTS